jgi:phosphatidylglycerophosphatase GEP4
VTYHLGVPVLRHSTLKPGYKCIGAIRAYFSSLSKPIQDHELIVVGDRIFTDIVMANRMRRSRPPAKLANEKLATPAPDGPLGIWTSGVWQKESMLMRRMELGLVNIVKRFTEPRDSIPDLDYELEYTRPYVEEAETVKPKRRRWGIFA